MTPLRRLTYILLSALVPIFCIIAFSACREKIDAGNIGLLVPQYGDDKGNPITIVPGATWYNPFTEDVVQIPAFVQHKEYEGFAVNAKDGSQFSVAPQINYQIDRGRAVETYRKYRKELPELEEGVIKTMVREVYRAVLNSYTTDSIMESRERIERQTSDSLRLKMEREGFLLAQLTSGLTPPESITAAIEAKNASIQNGMRIENELRATEAEAKKKVAKARGDAEALLTNARAEAEANRLRQATLTPLLIQQQWIEKWDGKVPTYGNMPQLFKGVQ